MEGEKRKSEVNDAVLGGSQKRSREDDSGKETTVTEEEVEEFYAILRRIHVAINYFRKGNVKGDVPNLTELERAEWLNLGSNVEVNGCKKKKKNEEENMGLDLNADPGTGSDPF
ncbi:protein NIM1-INTERACTING 2-like [Durio zibethinus]|uniref:Protein NIM1-INTERACTING 2-like n=1 Tax=Durio zibethinus TaxID=66656 RepID=A0A6P5Y4K6_DURZI|nr:protein NIM1-INTERACTING 2-like [Durio zibethinus]